MSRLIFLLAVAGAVYLLVNSYRKSISSNTEKKDGAAAEDMVRCAQCGVYLPKGESIQADGQYFCSAGHRESFRK
jgi:uncharacterized protein